MTHQTRLGSALAAVAAATVLLAACTSGSATTTATTAAPQRPLSSLNTLSDPKAYQGPSTAELRSTAITSVEQNPSPDLPATVISHDPGGPEVKVTVKSIDRIIPVDLAGSIAGAVYGLGLGFHVVGRDIATTFPPADQLPLITSPDGQSISAEAILNLKPTVVVTDGTVGPIDVIQQLRQSGVPVVFVNNPRSFDGAQELAKQVGAALGVPEAGEKLADRIASELETERAEIAKVAPTNPADRMRMTFLYLRGQQGIYYLFGEGSGADSLIDGLGGVDVAQEIDWNGMKPMTDEALVKMNPDVILVMTNGLKSVGGVDGLLSQKPAVALTNAGKNKRIVDMADGVVLSFGPRSAQILDALARAVYAPAEG